MLKPTIFREYDIRGVADSELLSPDIEQLGLGLGSYLQRHRGGRQIKLGPRFRLNCPRLPPAWVKGLLPTGGDRNPHPPVPTPLPLFSPTHPQPNASTQL